MRRDDDDDYDDDIGFQHVLKHFFVNIAIQYYFLVDSIIMVSDKLARHWSTSCSHFVMLTFSKSVA